MKFPICNLQSTIYNSQRGFTLLELMVSFAIIGIIALIIAGSMRLGLGIVEKGEERIDSLERIRTSLNIITSQIQSRFPLVFEEEGERKFYFQGEEKRMQIATNYSIWGGRRGYVLVQYRVEKDGSGKEMLAVSENIVGMDNTRDTILFNRLDNMYFEYFFRDPLEEEGEWINQWTDSSSLPEKVKLSLSFKGKGLSFIIPMRTAGSVIK